MSKACTPILYNNSETYEVEMTKNGLEIQNHLDHLEEELLLKFSQCVILD